MLRTFGKTTAKLRSMAGDFQKQFNEALKEAELDDVKKSVDELREPQSGHRDQEAAQSVREGGARRPRRASTGDEADAAGSRPPASAVACRRAAEERRHRRCRASTARRRCRLRRFSRPRWLLLQPLLPNPTAARSAEGLPAAAAAARQSAARPAKPKSAAATGAAKAAAKTAPAEPAKPTAPAKPKTATAKNKTKTPEAPRERRRRRNRKILGAADRASDRAALAADVVDRRLLRRLPGLLLLRQAAVQPAGHPVQMGGRTGLGWPTRRSS